ncbi:MAG: 4-(cytidine 5'-diphospho)-2-C-methyl-D-erythritol kinase [Firmicutes bacterium]|nr:4-(cytidine 5'-diphospho)-2-C-methyl-D-erythritol kinase [Bacillota bacterium]
MQMQALHAVDKITVKANGKVNLTLDIQGRRADGYHLLRSVMQSISLTDTVTLVRKPQGQGISLRCDLPYLPQDEGNLCWRAAKAFQDKLGLKDLAVDIDLRKEIPVGSGLGGGSTDAAAVLYGLNILYRGGLSLAELQTIGETIGADVPFCLQGGTCLVEGIGEQVTPIRPFPNFTMALVRPDVPVSTAEVYRRLDKASYGGNSTWRLLDYLSDQTDESLDQILANALESVTLDLVPEVRLWQERLLEWGAMASRMSGSGPTVFGLFAQEQEAMDFQARFQREAQVFIVHLPEQGVYVPEANGGDQL